MNKHSGGVAEYRSSEGKTVLVPYRGPVAATVQVLSTNSLFNLCAVSVNLDATMSTSGAHTCQHDLINIPLFSSKPRLYMAHWAAYVAVRIPAFSLF